MVGFIARLQRTRSWSGTVRQPIVIAGLSVFLVFFSSSLLVIALPLHFQESLGFTPAKVGTAVGSTVLLNFLAYIVAGSVGERPAAKYMALTAFLLVPSTLLYGLLKDLWPLIALGLWRGLAMSTYSVVSMTFVGRTANPERRGLQIGLVSMFSNVATGITPPLGIVLWREFGLSALLSVSAIGSMLAALISLPLIREEARVGSQAGGAEAPLSLKSWVNELRRLRLPVAAACAQGIAFGVILAFMPGFLAGRGVSNPGIFYTARLVAQVPLRAVAGGLSDRYGRPSVAGVGLLLIGLSVIGIYGVHTNPGTLATGMLAGAGIGISLPVIIAWFFDQVSEGRRGVASATYFIALDTGRAFGTIALGLLVASIGTAPLFLLTGVSVNLLGLAILLTGPGRRSRL